MTTDTLAPQRTNRWTIVLWVAHGLLAIAYLGAGSMKLFQPLDALAGMGMGYVSSFPEPFIRFVGLMEVLGAMGLVVPAATRILPMLTPLAAVGLSVLQVAAIILHAARGETAMTLPANLVLLALALLVVWGRFHKAPIAFR